MGLGILLFAAAYVSSIHGAIWDDINNAVRGIPAIASDVTNIKDYVDDIPTLVTDLGDVASDVVDVATSLTDIIGLLSDGAFSFGGIGATVTEFAATLSDCITELQQIVDAAVPLSELIRIDIDVNPFGVDPEDLLFLALAAALMPIQTQVEGVCEQMVPRLVSMSQICTNENPSEPLDLGDEYPWDNPEWSSDYNLMIDCLRGGGFLDEASEGKPLHTDVFQQWRVAQFVLQQMLDIATGVCETFEACSPPDKLFECKEHVTICKPLETLFNFAMAMINYAMESADFHDGNVVAVRVESVFDSQPKLIDNQANIRNDIATTYTSRTAYLQDAFDSATSDRNYKYAAISDDVTTQFNNGVADRNAKHVAVSSDLEARFDSATVDRNTKFTAISDSVTMQFNNAVADRNAKHVATSNDLKARFDSATADRNTKFTAVSDDLAVRFSSSATDRNAKHVAMSNDLKARFANASIDRDTKHAEVSADLQIRFNDATSDRQEKYQLRSIDLETKFNNAAADRNSKYEASSQDRQGKHAESSADRQDKFVASGEDRQDKFVASQDDRQSKFESLTQDIAILQATVDSLPNLNGAEPSTGNGKSKANTGDSIVIEDEALQAHSEAVEELIVIRLKPNDLYMIGTVLVGSYAVFLVMSFLVIWKCHKDAQPGYAHVVKYDTES